MIRIGLLGASRIAPKAVIEPASQRSGVAVTAVAARDETKARAFARAHGVPTVSRHYAALIDRDDIDLIYVATPPSSHAQWAIAALEAGKHVLCEKPFCMTADEAVAMIEAANRADRRLIEGYHYRFHAIFAEALRLVQEIGPITDASARFCVPIARSDGEFRWSAGLGGGAMMDLGVYPAHALRSLFAVEPLVVDAAAEWAGDVDARMQATLRFLGGVEARIEADMTAASATAELEVIGRRGRLRLQNFVAPQFGHKLSVSRDGEPDETIQRADAPSTYVAQLDHVLAVLRGDADPLTGGADALAQMRLVDAVYAAARRRALPERRPS